MKNPTRNEVFFAIILALYLLSVFSIQFLFPSLTQGNRYFSLISEDSERYIYEANIFKFVFLINELSGTYADGQNYYESTPKFGISALLSPFAHISSDPNFLHAVLLGVSFVLGLWKIRLIRNISQSESIFVFAVIAIVLFPIDLYWHFRILREPIANSLLEISLLLMLLIKRQNQPSKITQISLFFVIILLLAWRSQLAFLSCIAAVFLFMPTPKVFIPFLLLTTISLYQSVLSSGIGFLNFLFEGGVMRALLLGVIQWLNDNGWSFNVLIFSSFLFFLWSKFAVSNYKFERLILFFLGIVSLTLLSSESLQIRFVYPVFIFFKVFFVFYFIMQGNNQRRKGIHVRFNQS